MYYIGNEELEAIKKVFERKKLFRYQVDQQSECQLFEKEFARHIKIPFAQMVTSGTNALIAGLRVLNIGPGDEVLIPAYTFVATALAVVNVGATPVIINIDESLTISCAEIPSKITKRTKAIICVHMDGLACDMPNLMEISKANNLFLIEDTAQAIGGSYGTQHLGTWGDIGCFSLNQDKNISCGEGGIVVCKTREHFEKIFCLHDGSGIFNPANKDLFQQIKAFPGMSMRVSEISGAIMRVQLTRLAEILQKLRTRKNILRQMLSSTNVKIIGGHSLVGDCGSSIHFKFTSPEIAQHFGKKLREQEIMAIPPSMRPAHAAWKWAELVGIKSNPSQYLSTMDILMSTLKLDINMNLTEVETQMLGQKISELSET